MTGQSIGIGQRLRATRLQCKEALEHPTNPSQLRERLGPELAAIVLESARLQRQATGKLLSPAEPTRVLWVTDKSLQQATPWQVARLKSGWFGGEAVYDLCCGLGGDSLQLATRGDVIAVERDPLLWAMAEANLELAGFHPPHAIAVCEDVLEFALPRGSLLHIDPDRRALTSPAHSGNGRRRRTINPQAYQPDWSHVSQMVAASSGAIVKLAPASEIPEGGIDAADSHRCWISLSGTVREQSLLWGSVVERAKRQHGGRSAIVVRSDGTSSEFIPHELFERHESSSSPTLVARTPRVLIDPNAAIRAAGLTEAFARAFQLRLISGPSGFLAGADDSDSLLTSMESLAVIGGVEWWGKCDDRKLRKVFRDRGVYPEIIKVRGVDLDPAQLFKRYRDCGEQPVTLWIGRDRDGVFAAITRTANGGIRERLIARTPTKS